jgi:hypothetical protein
MRPLPSVRRDQALGDDGAQVQGQVQQQLFPPLLGEEAQDAVQGLVGVVGVDGGQAQVSGLGVGHGVLHGIPIADLADHDHVRRLAQRVLQGRLPVIGVQAHLALGDDALAMGVHELDGIFHRDDVILGSSGCGGRPWPPGWWTCPSRWRPP